MHESSEHSILQADLLVQAAINNMKSAGMSTDSGYCASPNTYIAANSSGIIQQSGSTMLQASPLRSPFKVNTDSNSGILRISPLKSTYSPFKDSSLSPFKLINQSPSKGSFDDWDKEFLSSFEENLFGMEGIAENVVDELLKSPQGKAFLERKNSPLRVQHSGAARRLRISPENNKQHARRFHSLGDESSDILDIPGITVKAQPFMFETVKEEIVVDDHIYGQQQPITFYSVNDDYTVTADKMSDTPIKPSHANVGNAPKRKLSMRTTMPGNNMTMARVQPGGYHIRVQQPPEPRIQPTWPSKERLKFARLQFQQILNNAVAKEVEALEEVRRKKVASGIKQEPRTETGKCKAGNKSNRNSNKDGRGKGKKTKQYRKKKQRDTYPQIKMALAKPPVKPRNQAPVIHKTPFSVPIPNFNDPGWYPSDDEVDVEQWSGPPPFYTDMEIEYKVENEDESSDDDSEHTTYRYETLSGRSVNIKRPRIC